MKGQNIVIMVLIAVVFGGGGFFIGKSMAQSQAAAQRTQFTGQFGARTGTPGAGSPGGISPRRRRAGGPQDS